MMLLCVRVGVFTQGCSSTWLLERESVDIVTSCRREERYSPHPSLSATRIVGYVTTNVRYVTLVEDSIQNTQVLKSRDSELCMLMVRSSFVIPLRENQVRRCSFVLILYIPYYYFLSSLLYF